jgi:hypothetical protein
MRDQNLLVANVELFIGSRHVDFNLRVRVEGLPRERLKLQEILKASRHLVGSELPHFDKAAANSR